MAQIAVIEPKLICPLGSPALKTLLGPDLKISTARCKVFRKSGILFIPLYHPAAALHNGSLLQTLQNDILVLKDLINRPIREDEITDLTPRNRKTEFVKEEPAPTPMQAQPQPEKEEAPQASLF
jgi:DNA polymerase